MLAGIIVIAAIPSRVRSQTVGPSPPTVTTTVNVTSGTTTVVGGTVVSVTGATNASNVTGGTLVWDAAAGPLPGLITVQSQNGNALQAAGGTILVPNDNLSITSGGGHAVLANGAASTVTIANGASVTLTGVGEGLAAIGGTINASGVIINGTAASRGHGAVAESGGTINLHAGTSISTGGAFNAVALGASGAGSRVNADVLIPVTTTGRGAMGIYLHDGGQVSLLPGSTLNINGTSSVGVAADNTTVALGTIGSGLTVNLNGVGVAGQAGSTGVVAFNGGNVSLQNLTVTGSNGAAGVWAAPNSTVTLTGTNTININSAQNPTFYTLQTATLVTSNGPVGSIFGVNGGSPISGLFSTGGTINSTGTTINVTTGNGAAGADIQANGLINIDRNTITTTGTNSFGVRVDNGTLIGTGSSVTTSGGGAALFFNAGPGLIDLTNSTVLATGANTVGLSSLNLSTNGIDTVRLTSGSLISNASTAVEAQGPLNLTTSGTVVTGGGGTLLETFANNPAFQPTVVNFTASQGSQLMGDAIVDVGSTANISLLTGSRWEGAAFNVTNVNVDPTSVWTVTANSTVSQTVNNSGLIQFTPPTGDPTQLANFKTLTTANYIGSGGTIGLNTFLGTDGSPSDRLVINGGTANGNSLLRITNAGGPGALTTGNGILVVDTINGGTTVPGTFALARPVAEGPYDYTLFRSSVDASNAQAWYLRSTINCTLASTDPICAVPGVGPTLPDFRPETSLYAAIPSMALIYGRTLLDTLHERVGDEEDLRNQLRQNGVAPGAWARVIGQHGNNQGDPLGIFGSGPKFDYDIGAFQGGQDLLRREGADSSRDHAGLYTAIGLLTGNVTHFDQTFAGANNLSAYSLGGYWTHFGARGWYLDAILQGTWYNARGVSNSLPALATNGWGLASSLEGGYPIKLGGGFIIEPQAQIVYQNVSLSDGNDTAATVQFRNVDSLVARIGARVARTWLLDDSAQRSITAWIRPSLWNEFRGNPQTLFSSAAGPVPFQSDIGGAWVEINAGLDAQITKATSLFASVGYQVSTNGNMTAYNGKGGLRVAW
ncbi:autotransporter outer membrane beta-barrel domain-containing protein [Bradyrhizobium sp. dw_411]|uniref:autotransporter family protein n=1 Tax=Bradyrhizobium sp. dw_411 TaxID=2720082 RepID=UPI001BD16DF8